MSAGWKSVNDTLFLLMYWEIITTECVAAVISELSCPQTQKNKFNVKNKFNWSAGLLMWKLPTQTLRNIPVSGGHLVGLSCAL